MRNKNRTSSVLIIITVCLLLLLSSGGIFTIYFTYAIKNDAEIINKLGIIRGSIQRTVKLELCGMDNDELINVVDSAIAEFAEEKIDFFDQKDNIKKSLDDLYHVWNQMKQARNEYREDRSFENGKTLLELSEVLWEKSNDTVFVSQMASERKVEKYQTSIIFFLANLALGLVIIYLIKKYVKDNLEYLVNYDGLTEVYNRRFFNEYTISEIAKAERYQRQLSFIMFDIDRFKKINDTYGHDAGDSVLKELSKLIQANIRKSDMLSRLGGEEFAILAPDTGIKEASLLSEKLKSIVANHTFDIVGKITISLGVTQYCQNDTIDTIYKRVDSALYRAKNSGRNRSETEDICPL